MYPISPSLLNPGSDALCLKKSRGSESRSRMSRHHPTPGWRFENALTEADAFPFARHELAD